MIKKQHDVFGMNDDGYVYCLSGPTRLDGLSGHHAMGTICILRPCIQAITGIHHFCFALYFQIWTRRRCWHHRVRRERPEINRRECRGKVRSWKKLKNSSRIFSSWIRKKHVQEWKTVYVRLPEARQVVGCWHTDTGRP